MFPPRSILCALALLCATAVLAHDKEPTERLTPEDRRLFAWFDQLDIEDFSNAKLVRVRTGKPAGVNLDTTALDEPRGFLLWDHGRQFRVVLGDMTAVTFDRLGQDPKIEPYTAWRAVTLDAEAASLLRAFAKKQWSDYEDGHDLSHDLLSLQGQAFALARYLEQHRRADLAARLLRAVRATLLPGKNFQDVLGEELGETLLWQAEREWADPAKDRRTLAARLRTIHEQCPTAKQSEWAVKTAEQLEAMAVEDDAHRHLTPQEFEKLSTADQARELVFQLRDESKPTTEVWPDPLARPWPGERTKGNGALKKLQALGLPAVPALLDALQDNRPTRSVTYAVYDRIYDLASDALTSISGVSFHWFVTGYPLERDAQYLQVHAWAEDWWKMTQEKGDLEWLSARVLTGEWRSQDCLKTVAQRHPEAFVPLALKAIPTVTESRVRLPMLGLLKEIHSPKVDDLLLRELTKGPTLTCRVGAAYLLRARDRPEALEAMLAESRRIPATRWTDCRGIVPGFDNVGLSEDDSLDAPLAFLLSSDSLAAVDRIREILLSADKTYRFDVAWAFAFQLKARKEADTESAGPEVRHAIEALLVSLLWDDAAVDYDLPIGVQKPKVAEAAAYSLHESWPDKYPFNITAPAKIRAAQLAKLRRQTNATPRP